VSRSRLSGALAALALTALPCTACEPFTGGGIYAPCDDGSAPRRYYADADADGFGDASDGGTLACLVPAGRVRLGGDCDDADPTRHPTAPEICNDVDDDCFPDNDVILGDLTINGTVPADVRASLRNAEGVVQVGLCGGSHTFDLELSARATAIHIRGVHPSRPSLADGRVAQDGATRPWRLPPGVDLTVQDVHLDEVQLQAGPHGGALLLDRVALTSKISRLDWSTDRTVQARQVTGVGGAQLHLDGVLDLEQVSVAQVSLAGSGSVRGLTVQGSASVPVHVPAEQSLALRDLELVSSGPLDLTGSGELLVDGGRIEGSAGVLRAHAPAQVLLSGTELVDNGLLDTDGPDSAVLLAVEGARLELEQVRVSGEHPAPLLRVGEAVWDGAGVVDVVCVDGACAP